MARIELVKSILCLVFGLGWSFALIRSVKKSPDNFNSTVLALE